jgi:hypothetical protein
MTALLILGITLVILFVATLCFIAVQFRRSLQEVSFVAQQALTLADRLQERHDAVLSDVMDRFMAHDFRVYKERIDEEEGEGGFESPEEEQEGGLERPGAFGKTPRADERAAAQAEEELQILNEDFDPVTGDPR